MKLFLMSPFAALVLCSAVSVSMARYKAKHIRNDSTLSGILVRFILKRKTDVDGTESVSRRMTSRAVEIGKGKPTDPGNPFGFSSVKLNLPMSPNFDPSRPRVQKLNALSEYLAVAHGRLSVYSLALWRDAQRATDRHYFQLVYLF
jgi:hypothetical protein